LHAILALMLAIMLGDNAESAYCQEILMSLGEVGIFWTNSLVGTMSTLALALLFWPLLKGVPRRLR